jgi:hypothetical protein
MLESFSNPNPQLAHTEAVRRDRGTIEFGKLRMYQRLFTVHRQFTIRTKYRRTRVVTFRICIGHRVHDNIVHTCDNHLRQEDIWKVNVGDLQNCPCSPLGCAN